MAFARQLVAGLIGGGVTVGGMIGSFLLADPENSAAVAVTQALSAHLRAHGRREWAKGDSRPNRIIILRHGETHGYEHTCDCRVDGMRVCVMQPEMERPLTEEGKMQALQAGLALREIIGSETVTFFSSPYKSCRQTFQFISGSFDTSGCRFMEDPRLRNQDFGSFYRGSTSEKLLAEAEKEEEKKVGRFFYRPPNGENAAAVYDRVSSFFETMYRKWDMPNRADNLVIITHSVVTHVFLMRWFHWNVQTFNRMKKFKGGQLAVLEKQEDGSYKLVTPMPCDTQVSAVKRMQPKE